EIKIEFEKLKQFDTLQEKKEQVEQKIVELELNIDEFKKHNIEVKLKKQIEFDKDKSQFSNIRKQLIRFSDDTNEFLAKYEQEEFFENLKKHESKENYVIFDKLYNIIDTAYKSFLDLEGGLHELLNSFKSIHELEEELSKEYEKLQEEFLQIQREINVPNLRADDFINFTKALNTQNLMMQEINKSFSNKKEVEGRVNKKLNELNKLYQDEYRVIQDEINKINDAQKPTIEIKAELKGDKIGFEEYLKKLLNGSGLSTKDYHQLSQYADCIEIFKNINKIEFGGNKTLSFREKFIASLSAFLTYQVPNKIEILYNGKELRKHSLGQRASALILFILTQKENDIVIIDQPEDDLDNQTIYDEVIQELLKLKNQTQFIFATHNANIPVLGDCEQVIVCNYEEDKINTKTGSVDNHNIQEKIINIMEGGKEAFSKRKDIYNLWKH
ncbi:MAG: ATP-binding protein, partial [Campylobacterales bacterium]|nr:ATP-binding protein [Campylobacterales bacterium]